MSNSSLATVKIPAYSGNYTKGRDGKSIKKITIHHMAGRLTAQRCGELFQAVGREGSTHYGVGYDGAIGQYVDEADTAWSDSNWESNTTSVTIETSNDPYGGDWKVNDTALNSLIKLVADIAVRNNLGTLVKGKNLTWHQMYAATACPGPYLISKMDYIVQEANKIINNGSDIIITRTPVTITYNAYDGAWLGDVTEYDINNQATGFAGVIGNPISALYISSSIGNIYYQVHVKDGDWLPEVKNREDYAGIFGKPIDGVMIKSDSTIIHYQVHCKEKGWLDPINGYDKNNGDTGYAGWFGYEIDAIAIKADDIITTTVVEKPKEEVVEQKPLYRIRKSWSDAKSQIAAYSNESIAIVQCPEGYAVYDIDGNEIYRRPISVDESKAEESADKTTVDNVEEAKEDVVQPVIETEAQEIEQEESNEKSGLITSIMLLVKKILEAIKSILK